MLNRVFRRCNKNLSLHFTKWKEVTNSMNAISEINEYGPKRLECWNYNFEC